MNTNLPINDILPRLKQVLAEKSTAILSAPPGSGKTTVVPLALLHEKWLVGKKILLLEPRRLAARMAASFMARQLGEKTGETVGYRVRFDHRIATATKIEVVTLGLLIRRLQRDPELTGIGLIIFDEFHERTLEGDLALALCRDVQEGLREHLRLLIMSATLAEEQLSLLLGKAEILTGGSTLHPVDNIYIPPPTATDSQRADHIARNTVSAIRSSLKQQQGDVLVFLPGQGEINLAREMLSVNPPQNTVILPLYGAMKLSEQAKAIQPDPQGKGRIILTTTIAETSLTIEGVTVVVDCGWKRVPRFDVRSGLTRLETVRISLASAKQRSGRAGRLGPGCCYRLWSKGIELGLHPFDRPEIHQADLAPMLLELALWGAPSPQQLCWLDPPDPELIAQARDLLQQLDALDRHGAITAIGREMVELPVHPRLAHMILQARGKNNIRLACDIAALVSERDILGADADSVDLDDRLNALHNFRQHKKTTQGLHLAACHQVDLVSKELNQLIPRLMAKGSPTSLSTGGLLSLAYPDRIASKRASTAYQYKMVSGRGASLPPHDRLQGNPLLAIGAMDGRRKDGRIFNAAPFAADELQQLHSQRFTRKEEFFFDQDHQSVRSLERTFLGQIPLTQRPLPHPDPEKIVQALIGEVRRTRLELLPWTQEAKSLQQRILCLQKWQPETGWPNLSPDYLLETLEVWLGPYLNGMKTTAALRTLSLEKILRNQIKWPLQKQMEQEAPTHLKVPSGSKIRLQYTEDKEPVLAVRLQELFGLEDTPVICRGQVKVQLHLLSPAGRPVQITNDLRGFWETSYHLVKKEMKGRYPKHYWPDKPLQAQATSRAKPKVAASANKR